MRGQRGRKQRRGAERALEHQRVQSQRRTLDRTERGARHLDGNVERVERHVAAPATQSRRRLETEVLNSADGAVATRG